MCKKTLEPIWEHDLYINTGTENQIKMEIFDKDKIGKVSLRMSKLEKMYILCQNLNRMRRWAGQRWM